MTQLVGLEIGSDWAYVVQRPPASEILNYVVSKWQEYEKLYSGIGEPLATRSEPSLTEGLAAFLMAQREAGNQPFHGEFFAELHRYDLAPDGKRLIIGRTDIEWRLFGSPNFTIEFKIIGGGRPAKAYVTEGMIRFVDGRYAPNSTEGAMWAFLRPGSSEGVSHVEAVIDANLQKLACQAEQGNYRISPSALAPGTAKFDSLHQRNTSLLRLAHIFVPIVVNPGSKV